MINNTKFNGSYELLEYVLKKYKSELPYNGEVSELAKQYSFFKDIKYTWQKYGVHNRLWALIRKDLTILYLCGKLETNISLEELKIEFDLNKKSPIEPIEPPPIKFPPIPTGARCL
jgi:hypothetical protein